MAGTEPNNLPQTNPARVSPPGAIVPVGTPGAKLLELPRDELEQLAEEYGLEPRRYKTRQHLVAALHERRQLIASLDRESLLDVVKWARRPVSSTATREQLAVEIGRITSMRFGGLSQRGLQALAQLRGVALRGDEDVPQLVRRLKKQEGFFAKLNRKKRAFMGKLISNMLGESDEDAEYQFLPPQQSSVDATAKEVEQARQATIKEEIEDSGLIGGIAGRLKRSVDSYLNQKLDDIESRIDRKLDEIDRRLAEWRDKEIANRIRILKITLWASVVVAAVALVYAYIRVYFVKS